MGVTLTMATLTVPNYAISYSRDGSLGELVGGAYSEYKIGLLRENNYQGFILTDWQITNDGQQCFGVEDYTMAERFMLLYKNGIHQVGGTDDCDAAAEGYELLLDEVDEEEAEALLRNAVYHFILSQMQSGLYDNPYITEEKAIEAVWSTKSDAESKIDQQKTFILLKNSGNVIAKNSGEKKTVYVPMVYTPAAEATSSAEATPAKWETSKDLKEIEKIFNVVTDTVGDPTGPDGTYTENDIIRASADEIGACDMILVFMDAPCQDSAQDGEGNWLPANLQYGEYTAVNARRESIAADTQTNIINDGYYGTKTETVKLNRSYAGNTIGKDKNYGQLELLQYAASVKGDAKVVVLMSKASGPSVMVFAEVEPLADAVLLYYGGSWVFTDALLEVVNGDVEPNGLLPFQMPASMDAVDTQKEDLPRDVECLVDADGNTWDFGFGLNWSGVINDERTAKYTVEPLEHVENITFHYADE